MFLGLSVIIMCRSDVYQIIRQKRILAAHLPSGLAVFVYRVRHYGTRILAHETNDIMTGGGLGG